MSTLNLSIGNRRTSFINAACSPAASRPKRKSSTVSRLTTSRPTPSVYRLTPPKQIKWRWLPNLWDMSLDIPSLPSSKLSRIGTILLTGINYQVLLGNPSPPLIPRMENFEVANRLTTKTLSNLIKREERIVKMPSATLAFRNNTREVVRPFYPVEKLLDVKTKYLRGKNVPVDQRLVRLLAKQIYGQLELTMGRLMFPKPKFAGSRMRHFKKAWGYQRHQSKERLLRSTGMLYVPRFRTSRQPSGLAFINVVLCPFNAQEQTKQDTFVRSQIHGFLTVVAGLMGSNEKLKRYRPQVELIGDSMVSRTFKEVDQAYSDKYFEEREKWILTVRLNKDINETDEPQHIPPLRLK
ncbi:hypothetical protein BGZ58_006593 [Dissophora ornata]|nr:hypothetical protein BGZ58_006593 [Dissophora ornata]